MVKHSVLRIGDPSALMLDYASAFTPVLLSNLSGAASIGDRLWTVADEGRTVECLKRASNGYVLDQQYALDDLFPGLVAGGPGDEIDLEEICFDGGRLWLCGSHCRVRRKAIDDNHLDPRLRRRPSRCLFGAIPVKRDGALAGGPAFALPYAGRSSLRRVLRKDPYLAPFLKLPSKEGGLDIEGLLVRGRKAFIGCRGPLIDSMAVIVEMSLSGDLADGVAIVQRHFIRLGGLGVRGLALWGKSVLIIAGPVADAKGPFRLHAWQPRKTDEIQNADVLLDWPETAEKPEAICPLAGADGGEGVLVLFDNPNGTRINGSTYEAEWRPVSGGPARER